MVTSHGAPLITIARAEGEMLVAADIVGVTPIDEDGAPEPIALEALASPACAIQTEAAPIDRTKPSVCRSTWAG